MRILGIEGGATRTSAAMLDDTGQVLARAGGGPSNAKLLSERELARLFRVLQEKLPHRPDAVSICLAGAIVPYDHKKIREAAARVWLGVDCRTASDRESALMAAFGKLEGIVVICGTGSSTFGMRGGQRARCGGWGHVLGDRGSAYDIALSGIRAAVHNYDCTGRLGKLARGFLQALNSNAPEELVDWAQQAAKRDMAGIVDVVFRAAKQRDSLARRALNEAAAELAQSVHVVARKLRWKKPLVCLTGGVFDHQPEFFQLVSRNIRRSLPEAIVRKPKFEGAVGAALLEHECGRRLRVPIGSRHRNSQPGRRAEAPPTFTASGSTPLRDVAAALTEQRNPRTMHIDRLSTTKLFDVMMNEEARTIPAIRKRKREIVACIEAITRAFGRGGRLFYVGAGTSGRLGVLDASECSPTFRAPPGMVQGILSGGMRALYASVEEAEDDPEAGAAAIRNHGITKRDVVVGIAASGQTPFVLGALREAARIGVRTFFLTFNPRLEIRHLQSAIGNRQSAIRVIAVATGPEVITGSTRLKAGTATKLILNMLTTISMIRLGKVVSNLMVDLKPTNEKLRDRACRIVMTLRGCSYQEARRRLEHANWDVKKVARK